VQGFSAFSAFSLALYHLLIPLKTLCLKGFEFIRQALGIAPLGDGLDCYAYESYAGSDLGIAGHRTLDGAIAWALLLIVSCDSAMSAALSTMKREF